MFTTLLRRSLGRISIAGLRVHTILLTVLTKYPLLYVDYISIYLLPLEVVHTYFLSLSLIFKLPVL